MSKLINFNTEARTKLKNGVDILANAVKVTLGPKGRNVIIEQDFGAPHITKDGVSVAREIDLADPFENAGAQLVKTVASKTCGDVGDGTSTSSLLTQAIVTEGIRNLEAGAKPIDLKKGIDLAVSTVVEYIKKVAIPVANDFDKLEQVATISANNDSSIGKLIADAFRKVGNEGIITIEESKSAETSISVVEGMQFDRGYASPYFVNNTEEVTCEYEQPRFLLYDGKIQNLKDFLSILDRALSASIPLIIIANDIDSEALSTLVANKIRAGFKICFVKSPGFGESQKEYLLDIGAITGCPVFTEQTLPQAEIGLLGSSEKVLITKDNTTIINGKSSPEAIQTRIEAIKSEMQSRPDSKLQERLAKLTGGVAILYVGANSEVEMKEKKDRVDDALCATRSAIEEGIVPGGGTTYVEALDSLNELAKNNSGDELTGINIIQNAITKPLYTIAENAGKEGGVVVQEVKKFTEKNEHIGYNAKTDVYENMLLAGVIDPAKVSRVALENAASVASLILTAGCVICKDQNN